MSKVQTSIIIVSWNTSQLLEQCLSSIYSHPPACQFDVWVVDNASTDGSAAVVRERFPNVSLIENASNLGFAAANNQAIRKASGGYLILLNPDTLVERDALTNLVEFMQGSPDAGAAGPYLLNPDRTLQESCYPLPTLGRELWRLFHLDQLVPYGTYAMDQWRSNRPRTVGAVKGACMILRGTALDQVGHFDEDYFMYTEEVDLCFRLKKADWNTYWVPSAKIVHLGGQSTRQSPSSMFLALYQSKLIFFRKNHGRVAAPLYKMILIAASLVRLSYLRLSSWLGPDDRSAKNTLARHYQELVQALRSR